MEFKSFPNRDDGLFVHVVTTDWTTMTNLTGTVFFKHINSSTDLAKIDSYICDDYSPEAAMVITFDCLRQGDGVRFFWVFFKNKTSYSFYRLPKI